MLDILIVASGPYRVTSRTTGVDLMRTDNPLKPGHYDIRPFSRGGNLLYVAATEMYIGAMSITDEPCITRILSRTITGRDDLFRARVRERDGKCVITGIVNTEADVNEWSGFHVAHIFPRSSEDIHEKFDGFAFSINPDDGYKIISFDRDPFRIEWSILDPICRDPNGEGAVRDELLRWHFRQAVLANMRGDGEPSFEMDFTPGTDMMGDILGGPEAAKRMEAELFSRLNGVSFA
ncbi:uncharacterized protein V1513DRAFT_463755 [Lipomyces chichibuensis]|uniref:uncharacterized protein n=1 Tax=Lipomyces chichibuensis TaxID=1546026 RepID=UPI003343E62D